MKTIILKHKFLFLFIILGLSFSYTSCKSDDDEISCETFLECQDGTQWKMDVGEGDYHYYIFNNSLNEPLNPYFYDDSENCYVSYSISNYDFQIIENSKNTFKLKKIYGGDSYDVSTFTLSNGLLSLKFENVSGGGTDITNYTLTQSSINFGSVTICD